MRATITARRMISVLADARMHAATAHGTLDGRFPSRSSAQLFIFIHSTFTAHVGTSSLSFEKDKF
jgi:hypothetical protein